jgi:predicted metal-dependent hydrolase
VTAKIDAIIHTRRKTLAIIVKSDGSVIVRAPLHTSDQAIQKFVDEKSGWIISKQRLAQKNAAVPPPKQFVGGESFLFLGRTYPLKLMKAQKEALLLDGEGFKLAARWQNKAALVFEKWYKMQALKVISERCAWYAQKYGFTYQKIHLSSARTRWGSCSTRGTLSFTWRLIMAPPAVLDYVIIHELVHTVEHNHAQGFWDKVAKITPAYKTQLKWLKTNGHTLKLD